MERRTERKKRTRQKVLGAARQVVAEQGFIATTAREVAAAAEVSVGTVFLHFPTMAQLAETLLDEMVEEALAQVGEGPEGGDLIEHLLSVSSALYDAYRANPELSRHVVSASLFEAAPGGPSQRRMAEFQAWVSTRVEAAVAAGQIEPVPAPEAFMSFFALYFGVLVMGLREEVEAAGQLDLLGRLLRHTFRAAARS
ncbi:MAG: TetR/AcrR family transcriptional regulator [Proteobacteria bacterium]|nr:TetR/AcrR family transcriptional regulator [Cystobacterineae bacterium]MCL2258837.1 TetR/AcrR family transcriptional regulator [Cystobacterineae bacterium]MCL2314781.1 TetR/AcrR family transcriptional regulator [Pseudomonadota bacterium]